MTFFSIPKCVKHLLPSSKRFYQAGIAVGCGSVLYNIITSQPRQLQEMTVNCSLLFCAMGELGPTLKCNQASYGEKIAALLTMVSLIVAIAAGAVENEQLGFNATIISGVSLNMYSLFKYARKTSASAIRDEAASLGRHIVVEMGDDVALTTVGGGLVQVLVSSV